MCIQKVQKPKKENKEKEELKEILKSWSEETGDWFDEDTGRFDGYIPYSRLINYIKRKKSKVKKTRINCFR